MSKWFARHSALLCISALAGILFAGDISFCAASNDSTYVQIANEDSSPGIDSLNDGPHILLQDDSSAIVFYLCHGSIKHEEYHNVDTVRFHGLCEDTAVTYTISMKTPAVEPHIFDHVPRIFAVSDVHGEYEHLKNILISSGVIDENLRWAWGDGHLVVVGDVFDRGPRVTECLWLIYRLEQEAKQDNGRVHYLLGNHELMVLRGDNRYIHERYLGGIVKKTRIEHKDLYGPDMVLGRWLRSKHTLVMVNDIIYVHGGIPPCFVERDLTMSEANEMARNNIDLRSSQLAFNDFVKLLYGSEGPFWYRGYFEAKENRYPLATQGDVDSILGRYGADAIVIGHTEVDSVLGMYNDKIMAIDVPVEELGGLQALLSKDNTFYRVTKTGAIEIIK